MQDEIDVSDINPAELLAGLYNGGSAQGMGVFRRRDGEMTVEQAQELIDGKAVERDYDGLNAGGRGPGKPAYFDYLHGKPLKVQINGKTLRTALYDRDQGRGAAQRIVDEIRARSKAA